MDPQNIPPQLTPKSHSQPLLLVVFAAIVFLLTGLAGGYYLGLKQSATKTIRNTIPTIVAIPNTPTVLPTITTSKTADKILGSISVYRLDMENGNRMVTVKLEANSTAGTIKEVLLWTSDSIKREPPLTKPFAQLIKIPMEEDGFVFVIFKDDQGNSSQIYADATYPFLQRGKLAQ